MSGCVGLKAIATHSCFLWFAGDGKEWQIARESRGTGGRSWKAKKDEQDVWR